MPLKTFIAWLSFIVIMINGAVVYRYHVGPIPEYAHAPFTIICLISLIPISYVTASIKEITDRTGETCQKIANPEVLPQPVNLETAEFYLVNLNRFAIFPFPKYKFRVIYDRLTKEWYLLTNQK